MRSPRKLEEMPEKKISPSFLRFRGVRRFYGSNYWSLCRFQHSGRRLQLRLDSGGAARTAGASHPDQLRHEQFAQDDLARTDLARGAESGRRLPLHAPGHATVSRRVPGDHCLAQDVDGSLPEQRLRHAGPDQGPRHEHDDDHGSSHFLEQQPQTTTIETGN